MSNSSPHTLSHPMCPLLIEESKHLQLQQEKVFFSLPNTHFRFGCYPRTRWCLPDHMRSCGFSVISGCQVQVIFKLCARSYSRFFCPLVPRGPWRGCSRPVFAFSDPPLFPHPEGGSSGRRRGNRTFWMKVLVSNCPPFYLWVLLLSPSASGLEHVVSLLSSYLTLLAVISAVVPQSQATLPLLVGHGEMWLYLSAYPQLGLSYL